MKILLVDDDPDLREILSDILKMKGIESVPVETGAAALDRVERQDIDVALIDLKLEDMSGLEVLRGIKARSPETECILLTGYASQASAIEAINLGAYAYFQKPYDMEQLLVAMRRAAEKREAEQALQNNEKRLRTLIENGRDNISLLAADGTLLWESPSTDSTLGYAPDQFLGRNMFELVHPDDQGWTRDLFAQILQTPGRSQDGIFRLRHGDGTWRWIESTTSNMLNEPSVQAIVINYRDITERKQTEKKLQESLTLLRIAEQAAKLGGWSVDLETNRVTWSDEVAAIHEMPAGFSPLVEEGINFYAPEWREKIAKVFGDCAQKGIPYNEEMEIVTAHGKRVWVQTMGEAVRDNNGKIYKVQGAFQNITERKQAQIALRESEKKYQVLTEVSPVGIFRTDAQGSTTYVNPRWSQISGLSAEEALGDGWLGAVHPQDREKLSKGWKQAASAQTGSSAEYRFICPDGSITWVLGQSTPEKNMQGQVIGYVGTITDITKLKQAQQALTASEAEMRALFASMQDVVMVIDRNGVYRKIAPTHPGLLVSPPEELLGKNLTDVFPAEQAGTFLEVVRQTVRTRQTAHIEYELMIGERPVWFSTSISPMDADSTLWVAHDITNRKRAEEQLHLQGTALEASANAIVIANREGLIQWANPAFTALTGYTFPDEVFGRNPRDLVKSGKQDQKFYKNLWDTILAGNVWHSELVNRRKDGTLYNEEMTITPLQAKDGGITHFIAVKQNITERKRTEAALREHLTELELLYQSGLALGQLLNPQEIGQKIIELLKQKLDWHHTTIRAYHPQDETLELLAFNQPGMKGKMKQREAQERFQTLISRAGQGMSGWVIQNDQIIRSGEVGRDPRYVETEAGIHSGLYVPMKSGQRIIGVISIESEQPNAFSEADERLVSTLAAQAASAFENARLFEETRQRVKELETLNRVSIALRAVSQQETMLAVVLEETLHALNSSNGSISLWNPQTGDLRQAIARGWLVDLAEKPIKPGEGIFGTVFADGETHLSKEFASDPLTLPEARGQIPTGWGGACVPIHSTEQTLGVMLIAIPVGREFSKEQVRLLNTLAEMTGNALQRASLYEETFRRLHHLESLRVVDRAIAAGSLDRRVTLDILLDQVVSQLGVDAADVLLLNSPLQTLLFAAGQGFRTGMNEIASVQVGESFAGRAVLERRLIHIEDRETASENRSFFAFWQNEGFSNYYAVPLITKGQVKGVLEVFRRSPFTPDPEWVNFLETLADQTAIAIDNAQLFENLQGANLELILAYDATIEGWSRAMDLRDKETEGHTLRVTETSMSLARMFGINDQEITHIRRGALLHDIGKIGVPDHILLKPGQLLDVEWALMRQHPQFAYDMLQPIAYLRKSLDIPYCHHEKWDGTGYPRGLQGEQIPLAARLFAIVDVYDALTSDRPYRSAWPKTKALKYIIEQSGTHFDPQVVEKFMKLFGNKKS